MERQKHQQHQRIKAWLKQQQVNLRCIPVGLGHHIAPSTMISGGKKSGTFAMHYMLAQHALWGGMKKEIPFLDGDQAGRTINLTRYHARFIQPFATATGTVFSDSTPTYSAHPKIIKLIKRSIPN